MKLKLSLAAFAGLIVGVLVMWVLVARTTGRVFADQYLISVMDQVNVALHIRADKQKELLTNIESSLPNYVLTVDREFRSFPGSTNALWMARAYYERNQIAVPVEIRSILDSLPAQPPTACRIRLRALDAGVSNDSSRSWQIDKQPR